MPISITMPALSPTMEEGAVTKWFVKEGDTITSGDVIAEVETDKATMEIEAVEEGVVGRILVDEGSTAVPVNKVIAVLLEEGESREALKDLDSLDNKNISSSGDGNKPNKKSSKKRKEQPTKSSKEDNLISSSQKTESNSRVIASPLARRMASQADLDLSKIKGSGPNGRIVKDDVAAAVEGINVKQSAKTDGGKQQTGKSQRRVLPEFSEIPTTNMRRIIAKRLSESKKEVPHFYLTVDCEIDALLALRKELNERGSGGAFKLSVNDFVIGAAALALSKVPAANASWTEESIRQYSTVDISLAVAIENGLITPVIRNADQKGLAEISNEVKDLVARARSNKLMPEEYQGGTFSISNLGMHGVREFAAVINPPQGAILAVGAGEQRAVVKDNALSIATVMSCTLSCDHRVVDGAVGASFLSSFKGFIEDPVTMML